MGLLNKGALVEYGSDLFGPLKNVVIFQFNPESLTRTIVIPDRSVKKNKKEDGQTGIPPTEKISFTAFFDAAELVMSNDNLAKEFGISSQLAALEKMVYPSNLILSVIGKAVDAIGDKISSITGKKIFDIPIPRLENPRILFIWGKTRILPVLIGSMTIKETQYDNELNPILAQVDLNLEVRSYESVIDDKIALGALKFTTMAKESYAFSNLRNIPSELKEIIQTVV